MCGESLVFVLCLRRCPHGPTWRQGLGENDLQAFLGGAGQSTANVGAWILEITLLQMGKQAQRWAW